jgi:hypothetical protein
LKPEFDLDAPEELPPVDAELAQPFRGASGLAGEASPRTQVEWQRARVGCLRLLAGRDACAKIVLSGAHEARDFAGLLDELEECAPSLPLYLTPATPVNGVRAPARELVESVAEMARDRDLVVRVVPQVHRMLALP